MKLVDAIVGVINASGGSPSVAEIADSIWVRFRNGTDISDLSILGDSDGPTFSECHVAVEAAIRDSDLLLIDESGGVTQKGHSSDVLWSDEELTAAVVAYLEMRELAMHGDRFVKKAYYRSLSAAFGRTPSSYEFRMQNISAILSSQGRFWIAGLAPAKNVGSNVFSRLVAILARLEGESYASIVEDIDDKPSLTPEGAENAARRSYMSKRFSRDPSVRSWILKNANGVCEGCDSAAPFVSLLGPFLEVHHVRRLADGGPDTVSNAVALCPNCHRRFHYALDAPDVISAIYRKVPRLQRYGLNIHSFDE